MSAALTVLGWMLAAAGGLLALGGGRLPDTVVYFAGAYEAEAARVLAVKAGLEHDYAVAGTGIRLMSRRAIQAASPLAAVLAPAPASQ